MTYTLVTLGVILLILMMFESKSITEMYICCFSRDI